MVAPSLEAAATQPSDVECATSGAQRIAVPEPGALVGGTYRLESLLGKGAMGVVFRAHDEVLDRPVAVKFIHPNLNDDAFRNRFSDEARAMARVSHPNIVQVHAFSGNEGGSPYIVMELVEGVTLERWIAERGAAPDLDEAMDIMCALCEGVAAIHAAATVHRDIKPGNVLLDAHRRPHLADMGLAVLCRPDEPSAAEVVGTPTYMAPEVIFGTELEPALRPRADVYSLACVAYEMFTGQPPFTSGGDVGLMMHHARTPPEPPSKRRPGLPPFVDDVILRALAKEPTARTPSAEALRAELQSARAGWREPLRILVADDHEDCLEAIALVLADAFPGATIDCVSDGQAALRSFERARPSVAILDLCMPEIDGMELTRIFRQDERPTEMSIIVLTASGGPQEWKKLSLLGADRFLVKPVIADDVVELVRRSLGERVSGVVGKRAKATTPRRGI